ncbi:divisome protein SepX/GlpR [Saccharomonospora iraqiensis]|uniref:divisome protein SepX/GlpR n=1 Tax=Saccharomonospora iraqiensis TaxID=52698 RepID=UPI00041FB180|nr:gephyrin-like molybdotransferase receptor GlpR [Saccharomonospora iraqiensis]
MPSSLIIVGLAAAWLAVLVPMVARKRQVVTQTNDAALAARVVRSGSTRGAGHGGFTDGAGLDDREPGGRDVAGVGPDDRVDVGFGDRAPLGDGAYADHDGIHPDDPYPDDGYDLPDDGRAAPEYDDGYGDDRYDDDRYDDDRYDDGYDDHGYPVDDGPDDGWAPDETATGDGRSAGPVPGRPRRYRPGRGGFDPEAAARTAKAKYSFRQRVVILLLLTAATTGVVAGVTLPVLWWAHGVVDAVLIGYLGYLRRQVRIEEEIRQRRLARMRAASRRTPSRPDPLAEIEVLRSDGVGVVGNERKPMPTSRVRRQAVVVDLEDEDPAFHELDDPGHLPYRRAVGE